MYDTIQGAAHEDESQEVQGLTPRVVDGVTDVQGLTPKTFPAAEVEAELVEGDAAPQES